MNQLIRNAKGIELNKIEQIYKKIFFFWRKKKFILKNNSFNQ